MNQVQKTPDISDTHGKQKVWEKAGHSIVNSLHNINQGTVFSNEMMGEFENAYSPYCYPYSSYGTITENLSKCHWRHLILDDHFLYTHHLNIWIVVMM